MNYELAKELKEAGFPQRWHSFGRMVYLNDGIHLPFSDLKAGTDDRGMMINYQSKVTCIPTLSELIEACGELHTLVKCHNGRWDAYTVSAMYTDWEADFGISGIGRTPEEAVARLWLALNKK